MSDIILKARNITKQWPGVLALDAVDFNIYSGCVNALVGENGAGKSTLMNIISGVYSEYDGEVLLNDQPVRFQNTMEAFEAGVAMVHQELNLIPELNVAENIFLGREPHNILGLIDYKKMHHEAEKLLAQLDFPHSTHKKICELKVGEQQLVEIAKALSINAKVLIFDEPTSSLTDKETEKLFEVIRRLKQQGVGIVYISHKMDELQQIAEYITVFRDGKLISEKPASDLTTDDIVRMMVGHKANDFYTHTDRAIGDECLKVDLKGCSFSVKKGEVVGIYGLMGAGRTERLECIFGLSTEMLEGGSVSLNGKDISPKSPQEAIAAGIALIPEERKTDGLVLGMDITQNITLPSLSDYANMTGINNTKERKAAEEYRSLLGIKSHSCSQPTGELSGGNQQKVVLAKWMLTNPQVLLLDEPTRGIDIGAKSEIYKLIDSLAEQGKAVIVVSSELPEIMAISDRVITLCEGQTTGEFLHNEFTQEKILAAELPKT